MAHFESAFAKTLNHEGGYVNDPDDLGGETYKGIARNMHPNWPGWTIIDHCKELPNFPDILEELPEMDSEIEKFYYTNFWQRINGDDIQNQSMAESVFDFCVNAGVKTGVSIAQKVLEINSDGIFGPVTLKSINNYNPELFLATFTLAKIARYVHLVKKRPQNRKFFFGWIRRSIGDI